MAKKESTFLNMVLTLFIVTLLASSALAYIYEITKEPIEVAKREKIASAIRQVVPEFDNQPADELEKLFMDEDSLVFYTTSLSGQVTGIAVESFTNKGFSGMIKVMVGFLPDGTIYDVAVLEHKETPGLGDKMEKSKSFNKKTGLSWSSQFSNIDPEQFSLRVKQDDGQVDAITAATISSRAFCDAVDRAYRGFKEQYKK